MGLTKSRMESPTKTENNISTSLWCLGRCRHRRLQLESQVRKRYRVAIPYNPNEDIIESISTSSSHDDEPHFSDYDDVGEMCIEAIPYDPDPDPNEVSFVSTSTSSSDDVQPHVVPRIPSEETMPKVLSDPRNPNEETKPKEISVPRNPSEETMPKVLSDSSKPIEETEPKMFSGGYIPGRMGPEGKSNPSSFSPSTHISITCTASQETEEVGSSCEDVKKKI